MLSFNEGQGRLAVCAQAMVVRAHAFVLVIEKSRVGVDKIRIAFVFVSPTLTTCETCHDGTCHLVNRGSRRGGKGSPWIGSPGGGPERSWGGNERKGKYERKEAGAGPFVDQNPATEG